MTPSITPLSLSGDGIITTLAGDGTYGYSGDGGPATSAGVFAPSDVAVDASGNVYIADTYNNRIRLVTKSTGIITTVAGSGSIEDFGDGGQAILAGLYNVVGVAVDASGNIYITDSGHSRVRMVTRSTGIITTVAGNGTIGYSGDGGPATSAGLASPRGVAVDAPGNIYIADSRNNRIRMVTKSTGIITTVAGDGTLDYKGDGGLATSASLRGPLDVTLDASGNIYIADTYHSRVRMVTRSTGIITTVAGNGSISYFGDGGQALSAHLYVPSGVALDASGNIYISDSTRNRVRMVTRSTGIITVVAGDGSDVFKGDGGQATSAGLSPEDIAVDASGRIYIADFNHFRIRTVDPCRLDTAPPTPPATPPMASPTPPPTLL
jgi:trimeric autotransporter adhesin